ncbi:MAG: aldehyde dehydrogenase family protein [bacterium]|nr:aldehyde dehydrogenase family protein [bacterium]
MPYKVLIDRHLGTLNAAVKANNERHFHAHWPEPPSGKIYGETANADGEAAFKAQLNSAFTGLVQKATDGQVGEEISPYGFDLGITYPHDLPETLAARATTAQQKWQRLEPLERAVILIETLERGAKKFFELAYATMHTTGQGFVMGFQSSGPHAFDRALEAIAMGYVAQTSFAKNVRWTKPMGKMTVSIDKTYRIVPKGTNLVIGCSTFPVWNSVPGLFSALVTGNSVIAKPHPGAVYPAALVIGSMQHTMQEFGVDPHVVQLATDTVEAPIALDLVKHPTIRVIDYTGGPVFGEIVEREGALRGKLVMSEKAGVNCVILDSTADLDKTLDNIAFSLSLYSGQMCTAPQNIFMSELGVLVEGTYVSVDDVALQLRTKIDNIVLNEKMGPGTLGALQNPRILAGLREAEESGLDIIRPSSPLRQPGYDGACSVTPLVLKTDPSRADLFEREWFGPVSFIVTTKSFEQSLTMVENSITRIGALTALVFTVDEEKMQRAEDLLTIAGAPVAFNLNSSVWVNQSAAFSDFHGAGHNPAGNAAFTDLSFVANRFNFVGVRRQV